MSFLDLTLQATVSLVLLVDPFIRAVFFRVLTENEPERRREYVVKLMTTIAILLGGSALIGKQLLDLLGIDLDAFGIVGGLVLVMMGFEMLLGGEPSRAQGGDSAREREQPGARPTRSSSPTRSPSWPAPGRSPP